VTPTTLGGLEVRCEHLCHVYETDTDDPARIDRLVALDDVSFSLPAGGSLAVLGPSGSGKSTLMSILAGLLRPTSGHLYVGGDDLTALSERQLLALRAHGVGVVLQNPGLNLLPYGTAVDNIRFAQRGVSRASRVRLANPVDLLHRLGLSRFAATRVGQLSGGEQQRLAVAIALANGPGLLLADEPTSQLDAVTSHEVVSLLRTASDELGTTLIAVTHDREVASAFGRTLSLVGGRVADHNTETALR
jgi:ABC-type lipoprotein export system ATPase subunit